MKYLFLAGLLCCLLPESNADCYQFATKPGMTHCQDQTDKTWHAVGSSWRNSACYDCTCAECCAAFATPRKIPSDCVMTLSEQCVYIVHKANDPTELCPIFAAVG